MLPGLARLASRLGSRSVTHRIYLHDHLNDFTPCARYLAYLGTAVLASSALVQVSHSEAPPAPCAPCVPPPSADGPSNDATAQWRIYTDMGRNLAAQGQLEEAGRYLRRALEMAREGFGPRDPHVGSASHNLAELLRLRGELAAAEPLYREAVALLIEAYGTEDVRVSAALHTLGVLHFQRGAWAPAQACLAQALEVRRRGLGAAHVDTLTTGALLAETQHAAGLARDALRSLRLVVETQPRPLQPAGLRRAGRLAEWLLRVAAGEGGGGGEASTALLEEAGRHLLACVEALSSAPPAALPGLRRAAEERAASLQARGFPDAARALAAAVLEAAEREAGGRREGLGVARALGLCAGAAGHRAAGLEDPAAVWAARREALALAWEAAGITRPLLAAAEREAAEAPGLWRRLWARETELEDLARWRRVWTTRIAALSASVALGRAQLAAEGGAGAQAGEAQAGEAQATLQGALRTAQRWLGEDSGATVLGTDALLEKERAAIRGLRAAVLDLLQGDSTLDERPATA
ncbi:hypothetical protein ACKKBF_B36810 [Auxenochlorella protothecoides x Auxenochlorella symbiontica]